MEPPINRLGIPFFNLFIINPKIYSSNKDAGVMLVPRNNPHDALYGGACLKEGLMNGHLPVNSRNCIVEYIYKFARIKMLASDESLMPDAPIEIPILK